MPWPPPTACLAASNFLLASASSSFVSSPLLSASARISHWPIRSGNSSFVSLPSPSLSSHLNICLGIEPAGTAASTRAASPWREFLESLLQFRLGDRPVAVGIRLLEPFGTVGGQLVDQQFAVAILVQLLKDPFGGRHTAGPAGAFGTARSAALATALCKSQVPADKQQTGRKNSYPECETGSKHAILPLRNGT